jgi:hypothetical protein
VAAPFQIVVDARDPLVLGEFWRTALRYVAEPPPPGYDTWADFAERQGIARLDWRDSAVDPAGVQPRLFFQPVPEPKTVKNRVHLDLQASDPTAPRDARRAAVDADVRRLTAAGATVGTTVDSAEGYWVVMHDPEGNEFCVQ